MDVGSHVALALGCIACLAVSAHAAADEALRDKTLVVWAAPADLDQHGGSALTIDGWQGRFDGIVFAELSPRRWMAGSNGFARTHREQDAWPQETAPADTFVQIAIVYRGSEVEIYRNGEPYAAYALPNPPQAFDGSSVVMFGKRHLDVGLGDQTFGGRIADARIYAEPLDEATLAALEPGEASEPPPWAWWSLFP